MNRHRLSLLGAIAVLSFAACILPSPLEAKAGASKSLVFSDSFNDVAYAGTFNPNLWAMKGEENAIHQTEASNVYLDFPAGTSGCEHLFFGTLSSVTNLSSFSFDFRLSSSRWIAPVFIPGELSNTNVKDYAYSGAFLMSPTDLTSYKAKFDHSVTWASLLGVDTITDRWISCRIAPSSETTATLSFALQGDEFDSSKDIVMTFTDTSKSFMNAYVGFQSEDPSGSFGLDNIKITSENLTIDEPFTNYSLQSETNVLGFYQTSGTTNTVSLYDHNALSFKGANSKDGLFAKNAGLPEDTSVVTSLEVADISFSLNFSSASDLNEKIAFAWGLDSVTSDPFQNGVVYQMNRSGGTLYEYVNGVEKKIDSNVFASAVTGSKLEIKLNKNGTVTIWENGAIAQTESGVNPSFAGLSHYAGFFGFVAVSAISLDVTVDNLTVYNTTYYVPKTKSVTHNFSNDFWGNEGYEDFISVAGGDGAHVSVEDGKLVWKGASDNTFFGSAYQYDQFILDYKLSSIYVGTSAQTSREKTDQNKWIGLDLSRVSKKAMDWGNYAMAFFEITPTEDTGSLALFRQNRSSLQDDDYRIAQIKPIPSSLFRAIQYDDSSVMESSIAEGDQVCVRWVSTGNALHLYLKKASEADFVEYARITGLQLNGYFALCCTGYTYVKFDDFSMANTSPIYTCADNEAPETKTITEKEIVQDPSDVDVNLEEEIRLNHQTASQGLILGLSIGLGVVSVGCVVFLSLWIRAKKKEKKHE